MLLTFNQLLRAAGLDPTEVRLVRHRPKTHHRAVFDAAVRGDASFREYQEGQSADAVIAQFRAARHFAAFVVDPTNRDTIFVGVWDRVGERVPAVDPFAEPPRPPPVAFETKLRPEFDEYRGRLVIDWGDGKRALADRRELAKLRDRRLLVAPFPRGQLLRLHGALRRGVLDREAGRAPRPYEARGFHERERALHDAWKVPCGAPEHCPHKPLTVRS
jgi:hypothetical protein